MAFSINTNEGAFLALQTLTKTTTALNTVQSRINTGLKVATAKDDGATYAIAQKLRADVAGLSAVKSSLDRASSSLDVAVAAGEAISDLLTEMKEKATAAADSGLDSTSRASLSTDYDQLVAQIDSIANGATFNGINAVKSGGDKIIAITEQDAVLASSISIAAQDLTAGGANLGVTAGALSGSAASLTEMGKVDTAIGNVATALATMGSGAKRLMLQREFVTKLSDSIEVGIGNLVDADMAKESANLQALQVKQQLGLQALSIANQAPGTILGLFR